MYENLKDQVKLDLCIYEAVSYTSVPWKPYLWVCYQLALISIKLEDTIEGRAVDDSCSLPNLLVVYNHWIGLVDWTGGLD